MKYAIQCQNLVKTYSGRPPVEAVRGIDLSVVIGECFGVLGPNGAGKTTTIEILEGLIKPTSGSVEVLGRNWRDHDHDIRQRVGVSLQETQLSDRLSVREIIRLFRSFYDNGVSEQQAIEQVSLTDKSSAWVKTLSGGQKQRLAVATAMVGDPDLLFLDEPTTGLDPASRRQIWDVIRAFGNRGRTVMLTTHNMDEAERLCDRVAIFDQGKVIALGTPRELIASLGAEHVIEFTLQTREPTDAAAIARPAISQNSTTSSRPTIDVTGIEDLPSVRRVDSEDGVIRMTVAEPHRVLPLLFSELQRRQLELASLTTRHASLEDVFVHLTGRHLKDD
jgi:ABC-2 type transport system ATP-binding protein